jgi:hypothetical protein
MRLQWGSQSGLANQQQELPHLIKACPSRNSYLDNLKCAMFKCAAQLQLRSVCSELGPPRPLSQRTWALCQQHQKAFHSNDSYTVLIQRWNIRCACSLHVHAVWWCRQLPFLIAIDLQLPPWIYIRVIILTTLWWRRSDSRAGTLIWVEFNSLNSDSIECSTHC